MAIPTGRTVAPPIPLRRQIVGPADGGRGRPVISSAAEAVAAAHAWFEVNSGWAPPDADTLAEWLADGVCRCPDECLVAPEAWCRHGLASWHLILAALGE
jgi:hypothetical protein